MKKKFLLLLLVASLHAWAQRPFEEIRDNVTLSANNYLAYPGPTQQRLTPAPAGYKPVYISHYGRHGSRYLINPKDYQYPIDILSAAERYGVLTDLGRTTLANIRKMQQEADGRLGELTPLGAQQHRQIARRMYERFPEVFSDTAHVDARSTVVIRCILSMENALQELIRQNPRLRISHDASQHDMYYMNQQDSALFAQKMNPLTKLVYERWEDEHVRPQRLMSALFTSEDYIKEHVNARELYYKLYHLAGIVQNSEIRHELSLYPLFTTDELCQLWEQENIWWYLAYGPNPRNGGQQPFTQRNLLRNIIHEADSCLALQRPCATLRYGHETMVMPLASLLGLNGLDEGITNLAKVADQWVDYRIFPMAANIQLVFYTKRSKLSNPSQAPILVKVLLNENEATLPLTPAEGPYYRWDDVRQYYLNKLEEWQQRQPISTWEREAPQSEEQPLLVTGSEKGDKTYDVVTEMPSFPGGNGALMNFINENLQYPSNTEEAVEGRVIVSFIVEPDGSLSDVSVKHSLHPLLDKEALRLVKSMPKWKPGRQEGKTVRCRYNIPILFRQQ